MSEKNIIEKESKIINYLVFCAKHGKWTEVWKVIGTSSKPVKFYLINVIPEKRRWGILHQAVYWNDADAVRRLLSFPSCDRELKTKLCDETEPSTPVEVADSMGHGDVKELLKGQKISDDTDVPTYQPYASYSEQWGLGLITITLAAYKNTFHPAPIDPSKDILNILRDIWTDMQASAERWTTIRDTVADAVYAVCIENSKHVKKSKSLDEFCKSVIMTYTLEENYMYTFLNMAFRRQKQDGYAPTGQDMGLGPYAVVYQMLLLFWPRIPKESATTYRRMLLTEADSQKYQVHTKFVWQSIVSSSTHLQKAIPFPTCGASGEQSVIFTIDNRTSSPWQPRNIEAFATYVEKERTYPAGARFVVTSRAVKNGDVHVGLRLLEK